MANNYLSEKDNYIYLNSFAGKLKAFCFHNKIINQ